MAYMKRITDSIWGHLRLSVVHTRLHIGGNKDRDYKVIATICMVLMAAGLPLLITILTFNSFGSSLFGDNEITNSRCFFFLYWVFCVHMGSLGIIPMIMLEFSWHIAHTYCNKAYPEQASKYERQLFHWHTAP